MGSPDSEFTISGQWRHMLSGRLGMLTGSGDSLDETSVPVSSVRFCICSYCHGQGIV